MGYPKQLTPAENRIESLDALRGVAVAGILVMNIYAFAMPFAAYSDPWVMGGSDAWNLGTWYLTHVFFDLKFLSIFSMLFGAGIVLASDRAVAKGIDNGPLFYRRQFWLLVFGALHAYLIWFGDILVHYALAGMVVFVFRRLAPRTLIVIACFMLPVALLFSFAGGSYFERLSSQADLLEQRAAVGEQLTTEEQATVDEWAETRRSLLPGDAEIQEDIDVYTGGYSGIVAHRAPIVVSMQIDGFIFYTFWRVGALMLIGMALMKTGVLSARRETGFYAKMALAGYGIGLPLTIASAFNLSAHDFDAMYSFRIGGALNYVGSILVALGHIAALMIVLRSGIAESLSRRFATMGRMAFSNYLMHSLLLTSVFYGYGLGLYGELSRIAQMGLVAGVILLQLGLSSWWLTRFRYGPAEWAWRGLSYGQRPPFRRAA